MKEKISWKEKYLISISECCSSKDIQKLMEINISKAREIKRNVEIECYRNNMKIYSSKVPTEEVLKMIHRDTEYYYKKMKQEEKAV